MVHDQAKPWTFARGDPLEHLQVAVGIAERGNWPAADEFVDADGFAGTVVHEVDLGELDQHQLPLA